MSNLKVFTCTGFSGHYPVGTAAVIVAADSLTAKELLLTRLASIGLPQSYPIQVEELDVTTPSVDVMCDGNY